MYSTSAQTAHVRQCRQRSLSCCLNDSSARFPFHGRAAAPRGADPRRSTELVGAAPWLPRDGRVQWMGVLPRVPLSSCARGVSPHAFASGRAPPLCGNHSAEYVLRRCITNARTAAVKYMRALRCRRQRERHCLPPRFPVQRGWVCEDMGGGRRFRRERSRGSGAVCVRAPCIINARGFTAAPSTECKHRFGRGYILADRCVRLLSQNGYGNSRQARALNVALVYFAQKFRNPVIWNMETERISLRLFVCFFYWEYTSSRTFYGYLYRLRTEENKTLML